MSYVDQRGRKKAKGVYSPRKRHFLSLSEATEWGVREKWMFDGCLTEEIKKSRGISGNHDEEVSAEECRMYQAGV